VKISIGPYDCNGHVNPNSSCGKGFRLRVGLSVL
jgi:hypothetical protein